MIKITLTILLIVGCFANLADQRDYTQNVTDLSKLILNNQHKDSAWQRLAYLTDTFGPRMWGTKTLEAAIQHMYDEAKKAGFENIRLQNVLNFDAWVRHEQSLTLLEPRKQKLDVIGLGGSVPTKGSTLNAEVIVVSNQQELEDKKDQVLGKIVCFNNPWQGYGKSVKYRVDGASMAAKYGAIGMLVRSVASSSIYSVHAGYMQYDHTVSETQIPCAAITVQDAEMFARMQSRGQKISVNLSLNSSWKKSNSSNLVFEIIGSDPNLKSHIVLAGGHIDTWDTGSQTGANDDGGGFITVFQAFRLLFKNGFRPRRTLRFIAWSGEQSGSPIDGAAQYIQQHFVKNPQHHTAAFESDLGSTLLQGFHQKGPGTELTKEILTKYLSILKADQYGDQVMTADIQDMQETYNVTIFSNKIQDNENHDFYFRYHHTAGDSMSMMNTTEMDSNVVGIAAFLYIIADLQQSVDYQEPTPSFQTQIQELNLRIQNN